MPLWKRSGKRSPEEQLHRALCVKKTLRAVTKAIAGAKDHDIKALVNHRYPDGTTPSFLALETGKPKIFRFLIDKGADIRMFLHRSLRLPPASPQRGGGSQNAMPSILVSLSPQTTLVPLLCRACELSDVSLVTACLDAGCSPSASRITPGDHTPLHISSALGDAASVLALCRRSGGQGAVLARDARGRLPRDVTTSYEVKRLLRDWEPSAGGRGGVAQRSSAAAAPVVASPVRDRVAISHPFIAGGHVVQMPPLDDDDPDGDDNGDLGESGRAIAAELESMGYSREDVEYCVLSMRAEGKEVGMSDLGDVIDAIASLDVIRKDIQQEDQLQEEGGGGGGGGGGGDQGEELEDEEDGEQEPAAPIGTYEYFINSVTEQHYVTFLTEAGDRYYIDERPGDRQWVPFPEDWAGQGVFVECDDDPAQIDPFEFDPDAGAAAEDGSDPNGAGGEGETPLELYQMFERSDGSARFMTCLVDGSHRFYADPSADEWLPFPEEWLPLGTLIDMEVTAEGGLVHSGEDQQSNNNNNNNSSYAGGGGDGDGDITLEEAEAGIYLDDDDDGDSDFDFDEGEGGSDGGENGNAITGGSPSGGTPAASASASASAAAASHQGVVYSTFVRGDGSRHETCMVDGSLYLATGDEWSVFPPEWLEEKGAVFEQSAASPGGDDRRHSDDGAGTVGIRAELLAGLYSVDPSATV